MRKTFIFFASVAIVALSGCSSEEIANMETSVSNAIGFNLVGSNPVTRATPITSSNITTTDFDVLAFTSGQAGDINPFMGEKMDGVKVVCKGSKWDYDNPAELAYWPTEKLDFYAVNPARIENYAFYGYSIGNDKQEIYYAAADEFATADVHKNLDIMYATAFEQTKDTYGGKVKLTFKHALSQVLFRARTELESIEVEVKGVKIHNVSFSGTFSFPKKDEELSAANWVIMTINQPNSWSAYRSVNPVTVKSTTEAVWLSDQSDAFITVPQTLTKWETVPGTPVTKEQGDTKLQSYLEITCKIKQNGEYLCGSDSSYYTIYVPFGVEWKPGYRYIYTLIFGGGYDPQGNPVLTPIEFEPEVSEWTDSEIDSHFVTSE